MQLNRSRCPSAVPRQLAPVCRHTTAHVAALVLMCSPLHPLTVHATPLQFAELRVNLLAQYAAVVHALLAVQAGTYRDAMQQAPATQQAVLSVLLDRCLPLLAADCSPETLADATLPHAVLLQQLAAAVCSRCLASELNRRLEQPQGAAHIQQALQVVAALPPHRPSAAEGGEFGKQHEGACHMLFFLCAPGGGDLPAHTTAAAVWPFLEALPQLAVMLKGVALDDGIPAERQSTICQALLAAGTFLLDQAPVFSRDSQLASWAAACDAAVRLAPVMMMLHERSQPQDRVQRPQQLSQLLVRLLGSAAIAAAYVDAQRSGQEAAVPDKRLTRQLWALHTSVCRLVAWLDASPTAAQLLVHSYSASVEQRHEYGDVMAFLRNVQAASELLEGFSALRFCLLDEARRCMDAGMLR